MLSGESQGDTWARVPGGRIRVPIGDYVGRAAYYIGDLDRKVSIVCRRIVRPNDTVLDVGANYGLVSVLLSQLVGSGGTVHAFELNPAVLAYLEQTVDQNPVSNVRLHRFGLGSESAEMTLTVPDRNSGAGSLVRRAPRAESSQYTVNIRMLDDVLDEFPSERISIMKIDVEGFEASVLKGADHALRRGQIETILFEFNRGGVPSDSPVFTILAAAGYGFFSIPRRYFRFEIEPLDIEKANRLGGHDCIAVHPNSRDQFLERIARSAPR